MDRQLLAGTAASGWPKFLTVLCGLVLLYDLQIHLCVQTLFRSGTPWKSSPFLCKPFFWSFLTSQFSRIRWLCVLATLSMDRCYLVHCSWVKRAQFVRSLYLCYRFIIFKNFMYVSLIPSETSLFKPFEPAFNTAFSGAGKSNLEICGVLYWGIHMSNFLKDFYSMVPSYNL